jgi:hypothetical protein
MTPKTRNFLPNVEQLDVRLNPDVATNSWLPGWGLAVSADDGGPSTVTLYDRSGNSTAIPVFDSRFTGGVRTSTGDINGDGTEDLLVAAGPGGGPHVKVLDGKTGATIRSFFAYNPAFQGGVEIAAGDVDRDGYDDLITGAGPGGGPHVKVFSGRTGAVITEGMAFAANFTGGVFVASGDINRDGYDDLITGTGLGSEPRVIVRDGQTGRELTSFLPFESNFRGGVRVASADLNGDGVDEIITAAGPGGGPRVKAFDVARGLTVYDRFVGTQNQTSGVRVSTATFINQNGNAEIETRLRSTNAVEARVTGIEGSNFDFRVYTGTGTPPADFRSTVFALPTVVGSPNPVRTISGRIESVSSNGSSMVLRRGDGAAVTVDLDGNPPPAGSIYIDTFDTVAEIRSGEQVLSPADLPIGRWVRVTTYYHTNPSATSVLASRVRLL